VNAGGASKSGGGGGVSFSVGQVFYKMHSGSGGSHSQGVQQPKLASSHSGIDLHLIKIVNDLTPDKNDLITFTIRVTNNDHTQTATNIQVTDNLTSDFNYISNTSTAGTNFSPLNDIWTIPQILPGATAQLTINAIVLDSGDNTAEISSAGQNDPNSSNNLGYVALTTSGSSGGNSGGTESDGSLANIMAIRNFERLKENKTKFYNDYDNLTTYREIDIANGILKPARRTKSESSHLLDFIPENGPTDTKAFIVTPEDLLTRTNAIEVFSIDYFKADNKRIASILAMTTKSGEVYNHTKMVCDRLNGAQLRKIETITIRGQVFIRGMLVQANGEIDYAYSFVAYEAGGSYVIDNQWLSAGYTVNSRSDIFNFQVWSADPDESNKLLEKILDKFEANKVTIEYSDKHRVPQVYVTCGNYHDGKISLNVMNLAKASEMTISGRLSRVESGQRESFHHTISLNPEETYIENIEIPTGYLFDIDFSVENDTHRDKDQLYFADGPWGKYIENNSGIIENYEISRHISMPDPSSYILERNAYISGQVKTYVSLFKSLIVGNRPVDISEYNQVEFTASGPAVVEMILAVEGIDGWSQQARKTIILDAEQQHYAINFREFHSTIPSFKFTGKDVISVVFNAMGDGSNYKNFTMDISQLKFSSGDPESGGESYYNLGTSIYPNPFSSYTNISFQLPESTNVKIILCDILGKEISVIEEKFFNAGNNQVIFNRNSQAPGNYFYKIITENVVVMGKMIIE